jgi:uncharacterized protein (TIGR03000 family)
VYVTPTPAPAAKPAAEPPAAPAAAVAPAPPAETTKIDRSAAVLVVKVPADATVYLADQKMSLTGTERKFRVPVGDAGKEYKYPVRVEVVRDGKTLVSRTEQKLRGGQQVELAVAESVDDGSLVALARR